MDGTRSTEAPPGEPPPRSGTSPGDGLAGIGAVVLLASLFLPWYGVSLQLFQVISQTGVATFGAASAALVLTAAGALYLLARAVRGYRLPRPLSVGGVLTLAGAWAAALVLVLIADRPDQILGLHRVELRFGAFVALGGAIALAAGGLRMRGK